MGFEFGRAVTPEEVEAAQRLRYAVYVEELGRYRGAADDATGRFAEPEDDHGWIVYVRDGNELIATSRVTWGRARVLGPPDGAIRAGAVPR